MTGAVFPFLTEKGDQTLVLAYVQPKAGRNGFAGVFEGRLKIRIGAAPVEGEANRECTGFLSKILGIGKSEITLVAGEQSRRKTFLIARPIDFVAGKLEGAGVRC